MPSTIDPKKSWFPRNTAALLALTIVAFPGSLPAHAFTCDDVRNLSSAEQNYWSKRLNLSSMQRRLIWVACYRDYHPNTQLQIAHR
jgi:hypothetical protein